MDVHVWQVPVKTTWQKSNTLVDLTYDVEGLEIVIIEDETRQRWHIEFDDVAGVKLITGDHMRWSLEVVPEDGGFFEITDSPWLAALGMTETNDQEAAHHFLICCRSELVEVAAFEASFSQA